MLQGEEGAAGGVEEEAAVMKAKELPTHLEDDGAVDVGDGVVAVGEADRLLGHGEVHRVWRTVLWSYHDDGLVVHRRLARASGVHAGGQDQVTSVSVTADVVQWWASKCHQIDAVDTVNLV